MENLKHKVSEMTGKNGILAMKEYELTRRIILPFIVRSYYERRFISDDFMMLMADYGAAMLYTNRPYFGELLFELAMQRISCGGVAHGNYETSRDFDQFSDYFTYSDQPQPLTPVCWNFIKKQAQNAVMVCGGTHMERILFGMLDNLDADGNTKEGINLKNLDAKEVFEQVLALVEKIFPIEVLYSHFATSDGVVKYKNWFRKKWYAIDKADLIQRLEIEGEPQIQQRKLNAIIFS